MGTAIFMPSEVAVLCGTILQPGRIHGKRKVAGVPIEVVGEPLKILSAATSTFTGYLQNVSEGLGFRV
jgi:hypothetical protein